VRQPPVPGWLAVDPDQWLYLLSLAVTALMLLIAANLTRGSLGRSLVAIRDGERSARSAGVNVGWIKALLFAVAGAYAGVGGALFAYGQGFVAPESFTLLLSFTFLGAVVVGGLGTVLGSVLGALFVVFVPQYAGDVNQALTGVIYGCTLIAVVYLLPGGAAGLLRRLRRLLITVTEPVVEPLPPATGSAEPAEPEPAGPDRHPDLPPPDAQRGVHDAVPTSDPAPTGGDPAARGLRP
jgi:branched-chain amino acid transport system permease protein